jgi:hypothetical protein
MMRTLNNYKLVDLGHNKRLTPTLFLTQGLLV